MQIDFTLRLTTPAFTGGADKNVSDGIRPPTIKALMRFWWRTMHGDLYSEELYQRESEIFGSTDTGQGLRVIPRGKTEEGKEESETQKHKGGRKQKEKKETTEDKIKKLAYFAYGTTTKSLPPESTCNFTIRLKDKAHEKDIYRTLWLMSAFGTLGGRARNGWGSIALEGVDWRHNFPDLIQVVDQAELKDTLQQGLQCILSETIVVNPEYTAFSTNSRLLVGRPTDSWDRALHQACGDSHNYRRRLGASFRHDPEKIGPDFITRAAWHDNPPEVSCMTPFGVAFGLPLNSSFSKGKEINIGVDTNLQGRRSSPVFFKVLKLKSKKFVPILLWLPAVFLPEEQTIHAKKNRNTFPNNPELIYPGDIAIREFIDGTESLGEDAPLHGSGTGTWKGLKNDNWEEITW